MYIRTYRPLSNMADKQGSKILRYFIFIIIGLGIGLYLGYWIGSSWKNKQESEVFCPDGCYNGGALSLESNKCTCTEGFSGQCCELETQLCKFGQWSEWTNCSEECGSGGIQYRVRENYFDSDQCSEKTYEQRSCNLFCYNEGITSNGRCVCKSGYNGECCECKIENCQMRLWSEWSTCTRTCGPHGTRFRTRNIAAYASCGGEPCSEVLTEEEECNRECYNNGALSLIDGGIMSNDGCVCKSGYNGECCECKIEHCQMTLWSEWSTCTRTCGPRGTRFRRRNIASYASCGGEPCSDVLTEEEECNRECYNGALSLIDGNYTCECQNGFTGECCDCKIQDCVMTQWTDWSKCTHVCGPHGITSRTRDVLAHPECGGVECPVGKLLREQKECNRMCENGGHLDYDNGVCRCPAGYSGQCCDCMDLDCILYEWSGWSTCESATRQVRSRGVMRYPKCEGRECMGLLTENRLCSVASKIIVPKWSMISLGVFFVLLTY